MEVNFELEDKTKSTASEIEGFIASNLHKDYLDMIDFSISAIHEAMEEAVDIKELNSLQGAVTTVKKMRGVFPALLGYAKAQEGEQEDVGSDYPG